MNSRIFSAALLALALPVAAQVVITESYGYTVGSPSGNIPGNGSSSVFSTVISSSQIASITDVRLTLHLTGTTAGNGWAGEMFVSLNRDLGEHTAILINQAGVTSENPAGFGYDGWQVTFRDDASGDIHFAQPVSPATILTGSWQPDGRTDPSSSSRPAMFNVFDNLSGNGSWHLTIADMVQQGDAVMTLYSWELTLIGYSAIPEPECYASVTAISLAALAIWRRQTRK